MPQGREANDTVIVPREPTQDMIDAAHNAPREGHPETAVATFREIYKAMLAAAPEQPPAAQDKADAARQRVAITRHRGECETNESAREVCEGIYAQRTDEVLGLVEALGAIRTLFGGRSEQAKAVTKIIDDAIKEHAAWTR
jgi:hypothetical protein